MWWLATNKSKISEYIETTTERRRLATPEQPDTNKQVAMLRQSALEGDTSAAVKLGRKYLIGEGVEIDENLAMRWWRFSASQGSGEAMSIIGHRYYAHSVIGGKNYANDIKEAKNWLRRALQKGDTSAQEYLDIIDHAADLKRRAASGNVRAQLKLFQMYETGSEWHKLPQDKNEALRWLQAAAAHEIAKLQPDEIKSVAIAKTELNFKYRMGWGVQKDLRKALNLLREASSLLPRDYCEEICPDQFAREIEAEIAASSNVNPSQEIRFSVGNYQWISVDEGSLAVRVIGRNLTPNKIFFCYAYKGRSKIGEGTGYLELGVLDRITSVHIRLYGAGSQPDGFACTL
jgi:hypothetical protein